MIPRRKTTLLSKPVPRDAGRSRLSMNEEYGKSLGERSPRIGSIRIAQGYRSRQESVAESRYNPDRSGNRGSHGTVNALSPNRSLPRDDRRPRTVRLKQG